jgi:hypothetical protein
MANGPQQKREEQRRYLKVMQKWQHDPRSLVKVAVEQVH